MPRRRWTTRDRRRIGLAGRSLPLGIMTDASLRAAISAQLASLRTIRHDLHAHPELAFRERRTSGVVLRELEAGAFA